MHKANVNFRIFNYFNNARYLNCLREFGVCVSNVRTRAGSGSVVISVKTAVLSTRGNRYFQTIKRIDPISVRDWFIAEGVVLSAF